MKIKESRFINFGISKQLFDLGFKEPCLACYDRHGILSTYSNTFETLNYNVEGGRELYSAPTYEEIIEWLDNKGYYIEISPEFYKEAIAWNWQAWWYLPKEQVEKEVGGTMVTLAALCAGFDIDLNKCSQDELERILQKIDLIREKQRKKVIEIGAASPLPSK